MRELLDAVKTFRAALAAGDSKGIRVAAAGLLVAIGETWLRFEQGMPFGDDESGVETTGELVGAIEDMGGEVPAEGGLLLSVLLPILLRLIAEKITETN
jgi:hypothetical protein